MQHFLVYHNTEKMDRLDEDHYGIVTSKPTDQLPGNVVWVISGEGQPRDYRLRYWFIVAGTEPSDEDGFITQAYGSHRDRCLGGIPLNDLSWFPAFRCSQ